MGLDGEEFYQISTRTSTNDFEKKPFESLSRAEDEHIEQTDDSEIRRLLERILSNEGSHQGDFRHFREKTKRQRLKDNRGKKEGGLI